MKLNTTLLQCKQCTLFRQEDEKNLLSYKELCRLMVFSCADNLILYKK